MKGFITAVLFAMTLAGCVAVPYEPAPSYGYYYSPGYYAAPPVSFQFGYHYYRHR